MPDLNSVLAYLALLGEKSYQLIISLMETTDQTLHVDSSADMGPLLMHEVCNYDYCKQHEGVTYNFVLCSKSL